MPTSSSSSSIANAMLRILLTMLLLTTCASFSTQNRRSHDQPQMLNLGLHGSRTMSIACHDNQQSEPIHADPAPSAPNFLTSRKSMLHILASATTLAIAPTTQSPAVANALPFEKKDRRQLELCLVSLLRLQYWAETVEYRLRNAATSDAKKSAYLEARLGAKAVVANKIGGGASGRVFALKGLEIKDCLDDLKHYAGNNKSINLKRRQVDDLCVELIESLASIVEFDGLETTQDPSPRSSLTMTMYNDDKATFVTRMLSERVAPTITSIVKQYSAEAQATSQQYVLDYYVSEMPPNKRPVVVVASGEA